MVRPWIMGLFGASILLGAGSAYAQDKPALDQEIVIVAREFLDSLNKGDYAKSVSRFDETMLKVMPADKTKAMWEGLIKQVGPFKKQINTKTEKVQKYDVVLATCEFEKTSLTMRVVFDDKKRITGLAFRPAKDLSADYKIPAYVNKDSFEERQVTVGSGEWELPGTVSIPKGAGPFPGLVLVHGSGPHDRDEAIGPNLPFRDLAWGLASRGVAVLRYNKRTKEHSAKMAAMKDTLTLKEEVTEDALLAAELLRKTEKVDPHRVFVLGHSLGGIMIPSIGKQDPKLAGLISLAGSTRPFEDVIIGQAEYLLSIKVQDDSEERQKLLRDMKEEALRVKKDGIKPGMKLPLGMSSAYWKSLEDARTVEIAKTLKQPMLILQGERDYQVTMEDFVLWKQGLAERKNVTFKSYPKLNHLFMEGEGKMRPEEYMKAGHVSQEVVEDIAKWVREQPAVR